MESPPNSEKNGEEQVEIKDLKRTSTKLNEFIPVTVPAVENGLIDHNHQNNIFKGHPPIHDSNNINLGSNLRPPPRRFRVPLVRKLSWKALVRYGKNWIKHPMNMALLIWLLFVAAGLLILGLLMLGLLNSAIPEKPIRTRWTEIVNQILNALFTIMCLYQHPRIAHHFVILCQWDSKDVVELRMAYCKTSAKRAYERAHIAFVIVLLHITCFAQYVLCALYWGWTSKNRPDWAVNLCIGLGTGPPVIAFLYTVYSPLGRKIAADGTTEPQFDTVKVFRKENSDQEEAVMVVADPEWLGGPFDCCDDPTVASLSFFCTFCVFGWNMERLGFGNMYVHIVTFILLCIAPLSVFYITTLKISDDTVKYIVGIIGCVLCFCGLLYGGFWRIQMRKKFKLPANTLCCGYPAVTDCFQWLFCWPCSLAQEVRTGNFYEIEEDSFYRRNLEEDQAQLALEPLPREGKTSQVSHYFGTMETEKDSTVEFVSISIDETMTAPIRPLIQLEEDPREGEVKK